MEEMEPFSPMSHMLSSPNFFIVISFGFKVRCNPSAFIEGIKNSLINAPRFSSKMDYIKKGEPVWVPVNVRVEDHVIVPELDYANTKDPDQFIKDYTSNIANTPMGSPSDGFQSSKVIHRVISFDDVKFVKNAMNMKVNDVLIGMTQAGISRYLSTKYDGYTMAEKKKILENIRLRGVIAVNLRPATNIEDLANMMTKGSKCRWGNYFGAIIFPLWIKLENDPLEYIRLAKATMNRKKISLEAFIFYGIIKFTLNLFGGKAVEAFGKRMFGHTSLAFSNVKGPDEEISFFDHPISYVGGSALVGSQALNIHFIIYVNKIVRNLAVDTTTIQDPHQRCDDMVESLDIIKSAIQEKTFHKTEAWNSCPIV